MLNKVLLSVFYRSMHSIVTPIPKKIYSIYCVLDITCVNFKII